MADYATNYTHRYRLRYRCGTLVHRTDIRYGGDPGGPDLGFIADVGALFDALTPYLCNDISLIDASFADENSDTFLPTSPPVLTATPNPLNGATKGKAPRFISFGGKSALGTMARQYIYGLHSFENETAEGDDYRLYQAESAAAAAIITAYIAVTDKVAIDRQSVGFIYNYCNLGVNPRVLRSVRG